MIIGEGLPFIKDYVSSINEAISRQSPESKHAGSHLLFSDYWLPTVCAGSGLKSLVWTSFNRWIKLDVLQSTYRMGAHFAGKRHAFVLYL
jgi:hypothetical protein